MSEQFFQKKELFFNRWASNYDCLLTTSFYQAIHQRLLEFVDLPERSQVLDIGCGTGRLLNRLADRFPTLMGIGCDLSPEMLKQARRSNQHRPRLIFVKGNAESLPFADAQFDTTFNTISFLHYPHPERVFAEVSRVLKPQGRYYLADWQLGSLSSFPLTPEGIRFYTFPQREKLGEAAGLQCLGHHYLLAGVALSIFEKGLP
jgi:ubiquinone/menaquinone biosynthesis C-methylase UbiE